MLQSHNQNYVIIQCMRRTQKSKNEKICFILELDDVEQKASKYESKYEIKQLELNQIWPHKFACYPLLS